MKLRTYSIKLTKRLVASKSTGDKALNAAVSIALSGIGIAFMGKGLNPNMGL